MRVTYSQDWPAYNEAQTKEKALFQKLLHDLCKNVQEPVQTNGRPRLALRDMVFSAAFKVYSTVSGRRFATDLQEAHGKGYIERVPHYNSVFNYFENPELTPVLRALIAQSGTPLRALETDFAIDSSGFSTSQYVRWFNVKYGRDGQKIARDVDAKDWIKMHLMCGVKTNVVTSVEITGRYESDFHQLEPLVEQTAKNFDMEEVSADKGYSSLKSHEVIDLYGATPFIAFRSNSTGCAGGLFEKMFAVFTLHREYFLAHYHQRSNVETTFHMIKSKFGSRLRSKTPVAQTNEALAKVLCHNLCCVIQSMFEFGIEANF